MYTDFKDNTDAPVQTDRCAIRIQGVSRYFQHQGRIGQSLKNLPADRSTLQFHRGEQFGSYNTWGPVGMRAVATVFPASFRVEIVVWLLIFILEQQACIC